MKKIIYLLTITLSLASCVREVDDLFDSPSSLRVEKAVAEYQKILRNTEHGWAMEYYPANTQAYGGYLFTMKFTQGDRVQVSSELKGDPTEVKESLYSIKKDISLTLNFDTYNEIFHYFSDPDPHAPGLYSHFGFKENKTSGNGYEGDYEFVFSQVSDDLITLKGKKTNNTIRMTKLSEPPQSYIAKEMQVSAQVIFPGCVGYVATIEGKEARIEFEKMARRLTVHYDAKEETTGFNYTATGLRFYRPIEVGGKKAEEFTWNKDEQTLTEVNSPNCVFIGVIHPDHLNYAKWIGKYIFKYKTGKEGEEKSMPVELKEDIAPESYWMVGALPYPIKLQYNIEKDMLEAHTQRISDSQVYLAVWEVEHPDSDESEEGQAGGRFVWDEGLGFNLELVEGSDPKCYKFVDNGEWGYEDWGVWKRWIARGFLFWIAKVEVLHPHENSRLIDMSLTRSN